MTENAKTRQNAYFEMTPKQEHFFIHTFSSFQCILFFKKKIFSVANNGEGGGIRLCPLLAPLCNLTGSNWHIAHLNHVYYKIRLH